MNKKQRNIILIGIILVLICGLFPPYEGELRDNVKQEIGYHFLFTSPSSEKVYDEIFSDFPENSDYPEKPQYEKSEAHMYQAHINTSKYYIQIVTIILVIVGLFFLFKTSKQENPGS